MRFRGAVEAAEGFMVWSWVLIFGSSNGPCVRMGDRAGVVLLVLAVMESEGDDSKE